MDEIEMSSTLHVPIKKLGEIVQKDALIQSLLGDLPREWELIRAHDEGHGDAISVALVFASHGPK